MWDRVGGVSWRFVDKWEQQNVPIIIIIVMAVIPFYDNQSLRANTLNVLLCHRGRVGPVIESPAYVADIRNWAKAFAMHLS